MAVGAAALSLGACGGADREETSAQTSAVLAGTPSARDAVVSVLNPAELCSGFLISADLVLTARHCVGPVTGASVCAPFTFADGAVVAPGVPGEPYEPGQITVRVGATFNRGRVLRVAEVILPPDNDDPPMCGNDVALLRLTAPVDDVEPIAPRIDAPPGVGESVTVVGFGQTGGGDPDTAGRRLERADAHVAAVGRTTDAVQTSLVRTLMGELIVDQGPCFGDSGGPLLDGHGRSIGVMSRGRGAVCQSMIYERIDMHATWLRTQAVAAAMARGGEPPAWAADGDAGMDTDAAATTDAAGAVDDGGDAATSVPPAPRAGCGCRVVVPRGDAALARVLWVLAWLTLLGARRASAARR